MGFDWYQRGLAKYYMVFDMYQWGFGGINSVLMGIKCVLLSIQCGLKVIEWGLMGVNCVSTRITCCHRPQMGLKMDQMF